MAASTVIRHGLLRMPAHVSRAVPRPMPSLFTYPGLDTRPWWAADEEQFPILRALRERHDAVAAEGVALAEKGVPSDYETKEDEHTLHSGRWDWHSAVLGGEPQGDFAVHCPVTAEILLSYPGLMTRVPFAYSFCSTLHPGSTIAPHTAPCNLRVRVHYPIVAPAGATLTVGGESRAWEVGKPLVFDDAFEHEARHDGPQHVGPRIVLLFDLWHPGLTAEEISSIQLMFAQMELERAQSRAHEAKEQ